MQIDRSNKYHHNSKYEFLKEETYEFACHIKPSVALQSKARGQEANVWYLHQILRLSNSSCIKGRKVAKIN